MARTNPYTIDEENGIVRGAFTGPVTVETLNEQLPDGESIEKIHECDCGDRTRRRRVSHDDKWDLYLCGTCDGLYGVHNVRADYY